MNTVYLHIILYLEMHMFHWRQWLMLAEHQNLSVIFIVPCLIKTVFAMQLSSIVLYAL